MSAPDRPKRISLTKTQLRTELGAELLSLCESITADGKLVTQEVEALRLWLDDSVKLDLPAAKHLRGVVERVIADGQITREECREVYHAVEAVLPPEVRRVAAAARRSIEATEREAAKAERDGARERNRQERQRNVQIASANFMVAGCRYEGRPAIIAAYAEPGDPVRLRRDRENRHSQNAISIDLENGRQIGFVPEEDATELAPLIDDRAKCVAYMTKILSGGRSPIPVVQVRLYPADTTLDVDGLSRGRQGIAIGVSEDSEGDRPSALERSNLGFWFAALSLAAAIVGAIILLS
jgi:hypothetical protein